VPFYSIRCIQQWLSLVLNLIVRALAIVLVAIAPGVRGTTIGPGSLGVAPVPVLQFNQLLKTTIESWTKLEAWTSAIHMSPKTVRQNPLPCLPGTRPAGNSGLLYWNTPYTTNNFRSLALRLLTSK
jgi:hypothetical protein